MHAASRHSMIALKMFLIIACCAMFMGLVAARPESSGYHLVRKVTLGGPGGWDYFTVDFATHRIFIPRGTHTMVLDPDGKVVADMQDMEGAHGIDFAPELKRGFTSNGGAHSMTIFDMDSLKI